jgi:signal transduction histidine kinase
MLNKQKRFISDAAHELKTPLTAIKTELEVELRSKNLELPQAKKAMQEVILEVDKVHALTNSLLTLSKYQNLNGINHREEIELNKLLETLAKGKNIELNLIDATVYGDKLGLERLFINLIDNAQKYSAEKSPIKVEMEVKGGHVNVNVTDTGIGISSEYLP